MLVNFLASLNAISMQNNMAFRGMAIQDSALNNIGNTSLRGAYLSDQRSSLEALKCDTFMKVADAQLDALEKAEKKNNNAPKYGA
ncbi:MAG: hypothetical protein PHV37_04105 [Candidatus Gastranaerophilales bacterium]|nr:hypothetical protein [Candidatus Gastranaerophilales bacterium]